MRAHRSTMVTSSFGKRLGYLSGAPRASTRSEAEAVGPRTHMLGIINAFRHLGWDVRPYIVGDRIPLKWIAGGGEHALRGSLLKRVVADLVRLGLGVAHGWWALRELGEVDWVYERYGAFQALGWWFQRKGIPWILETNGLYYHEARWDRLAVALSGLLRKAEQWAYQQCDVLICISQALSDLIVQNMGIPANKIIVLPNGVDPNHLDPSQAHPIRLFDGPTIGFVGGLLTWHQLDLLIEAIAHLRQEGIFYRLIIVGDGVMRKPWEALVASLGLSEQVRFVGRVPWEEIPNWIAGFDLGYAGIAPHAIGVVYNSPLKLYEYAAMGKPVVASNCADVQKLMEDGLIGYYFEPGNLESLCHALRRAYTDREHWPEVGTHNRSIIVAKHSWERRVSELIKSVEAILGEKYGTPYPVRRQH